MTQIGSKARRMTSVRSIQIPGVAAAKSGNAKKTTSKAKCSTMAGRRPKAM
jgi:hypothetical protein